MYDKPQVTREQVARSVRWTLLESIGVSGLSIIGLIVVARFVAPADLGVAAMAQGIVQILTIPVEFLFVDALIRHHSPQEDDFNAAHTVSVLMGFVLMMLCWLASGPISLMLNAPQMAGPLSWMSISLFAVGFGVAITARQRREMEFRALAIRSFVGRLCGVSAGIAVALMGGGVWSLVAQQVLMVLLANLVLWLQSTHRPSFTSSLARAKPLAQFGIRSVGVIAVNMSVQRVFTIWAGSALGTVAAGYFNLAFRVVDILRDILANVVNQLSLPMFARQKGDKEQMGRTMKTAIGFTCAVTFPLFAGLALCADDFIMLVFGAAWAPASPYVALLACLTLVYFSRLYSNPLLSANGHPHLPMVPDIGAFVVMVIAMATFGHSSITLAFVAWAIRLCASLPIDLYNVKRIGDVGYREQLAGVWSPLLAVIAMAVAIMFCAGFMPSMPFLRMMVTAIIGAAAYVICLWLIDRERIKQLYHFLLAALPRRSAPH